jgi:ABC-2 type transport system ATP-binding protein
MSGSVLSCRGLCKSYNPAIPVLYNFDFELQPGRIVGLLGPNGCGKSTLLKLISGILVPDSGVIEICGQPRSEKTNGLISYLPERPYFSSAMKVEQMLRFFSEFYEDFDEPRARKMLGDLGIDPEAQLRSLSKGTKEKVQLILVMARQARLYLLDEPIGGVDPAAREYILSTIVGNYNPEATVLITTHLITDIEPVLDEFAFMGYGGKILLGGNADEIRQQYGKSLDELFREGFRCSRNV